MRGGSQTKGKREGAVESDWWGEIFLDVGLNPGTGSSPAARIHQNPVLIPSGPPCPLPFQQQTQSLQGHSLLIKITTPRPLLWLRFSGLSLAHSRGRVFPAPTSSLPPRVTGHDKNSQQVTHVTTWVGLLWNSYRLFPSVLFLFPE